MKLVVSAHSAGAAAGSETVLELELADDMAMSDVKVLVECETGIPSDTMAVIHRNKELHESGRTLAQYGVRDGDRVVVCPSDMASSIIASAHRTAAGGGAGGQQRQQPSGAAMAFPDLLGGMANIAVPSRSSAHQMVDMRMQNLIQERERLRNDPYTMSLIRENNPELAQAIMGDDIRVFAEIVRKQQEERRSAEAERQRRMQALAANPFDLEAQRAIEEEIQRENVERLRQSAIEHMPESFASVVMLYIDVKVNGTPLKAFVDSGAQMTIMSAACAERCGIMRLVDRRFQGMAVGVGTQKIIGRVHMYQIEIGDDFLPTSFSILENQPMDLLLGLDMLRRHQCCIDLRTNELVIGSSGNRTPFLSEKDLPESARHKDGAAPAPNYVEDSSTSPQQKKPALGNFPEAHIDQLSSLGFSREQAIEALTLCEGNPEQAANYLLQQQ